MKRGVTRKLFFFGKLMKLRNLFLTLLVWVLLTGGFLTIGVVALEWQKWNGLANHGVEINGFVVSKEPQNHYFIRYSYAVNRNAYSGLGSAGSPNPEFDQLHVGDQVKVVYDSRNPAESTLGSAQVQSSSITRGVVFLTILGPLMSLGAMYARGWLPIRRN